MTCLCYTYYSKEREVIKMSWLEWQVVYTDYCIECDEKGIEPLDFETWMNEDF